MLSISVIVLPGTVLEYVTDFEVLVVKAGCLAILLRA
jgi:hypothetical protein